MENLNKKQRTKILKKEKRMKKFRLEITECPPGLRTEVETIALIALEENDGNEDAMWLSIYKSFPPSKNTFVDKLSISVKEEKE